MVAVRGMTLVISVLLLVAIGGGKWVVEAEEVHHVIGGDRGWDTTSDVQAWSSGRTFKVGDNIWFAYSAAEEIIAELRSREEFDTCNVSNPIKMYTDGLNRVKLEGEGSRYFASGTPETCKNGLKLHVNVLPSQPQPQPPATKSVNKPVIRSSSSTVMADGPTTPSSSSKLGAGVLLLWVLMLSMLSHHLGF